jgi:F420-dependent oxidoreductase-like protein
VIEIAIMIEGQNGLTWERWQRLAQAVEELGFTGLYRSDHYTNAKAPDLDSLELWVSLTWLASHTKRIEFGSLVSPLSFRHPTLTARMAAAVDDLSGGRLHLGLGAGWQEREHTNYGWELLDANERFHRFQEGLDVITLLFENDEPVHYEGEYFRLRDAILLPHPQRLGGPPVVIGGNGVKMTLPLAARYSNEWNGVYVTPDRYAELNSQLDTYLQHRDRKPSDVKRSVMVGCEFGRDAQEVAQRVKERTAGKLTQAELRERGLVVGTGEEIAEQISSYAKAGAQRIMLQWLDLDDLEGLQTLAKGILHLQD